MFCNFLIYMFILVEVLVDCNNPAELGFVLCTVALFGAFRENHLLITDGTPVETHLCLAMRAGFVCPG